MKSDRIRVGGKISPFCSLVLSACFSSFKGKHGASQQGTNQLFHPPGAGTELLASDRPLPTPVEPDSELLPGKDPCGISHTESPPSSALDLVTSLINFCKSKVYGCGIEGACGGHCCLPHIHTLLHQMEGGGYDRSRWLPERVKAGDAEGRTAAAF